MYRFMLLLQYTTPSAILLGAIASLRGCEVSEASTLLFWQQVALWEGEECEFRGQQMCSETAGSLDEYGKKTVGWVLKAWVSFSWLEWETQAGGLLWGIEDWERGTIFFWEGRSTQVLVLVRLSGDFREQIQQILVKEFSKQIFLLLSGSRMDCTRRVDAS